MNCADLRDRLAELADGSSQATPEIDRHLNSCSRCRHEYELYQLTVVYLQQLPEVEPPAGLHQRLLARVAAETAAPPAPAVTGRRRFRLPLGWVASAAAVSLLAVSLALYQQMPKPTPTPTEVDQPQLVQQTPEPAGPTEPEPEPNPAEPVVVEPAEPNEPAQAPDPATTTDVESAPEPTTPEPMTPEPPTADGVVAEAPPPPVRQEPGSPPVQEALLELQPEQAKTFLGAKQFRRGKLTVMAPEPLQVASDLQAMAEAIGGRADQVADGVVIVRVPASRFEEAISKVEALAAPTSDAQVKTMAMNHEIDSTQMKAKLLAQAAQDLGRRLEADPTNEALRNALANLNGQLVEYNETLVLFEQLTSEAELEVILSK